MTALVVSKDPIWHCRKYPMYMNYHLQTGFEDVRAEYRA
jgi:hypothetical protein